jgi:hypothetical protein
MFEYSFFTDQLGKNIVFTLRALTHAFIRAPNEGLLSISVTAETLRLLITRAMDYRCHCHQFEDMR